MSHSYRSCCADVHYEVSEKGRFKYRGLKMQYAEQLPNKAPVLILILPAEATVLRDQIIEEATALMDIEDDRILCPIDIVEINNEQIGFAYAYEKQVSLAQVFERYEHEFSESVSVMICKALLELMGTFHKHGHSLGGIHGDNVQILGRKKVRLGPIVPTSCKAFLNKPLSIFNVEQASVSELTQADDVYGVAVLLLCFLQKNLWALGAANETTQQFVKQRGLLDYVAMLTDVSDDTLAFLNQAFHEDATKRYQDADTMNEDMGRSLAGLSLRIAKQVDKTDESMRSNLYNTQDIHDHIEKKEFKVQVPQVKIDRKRLKILVKLVVIDEIAITAHINLAPGTSFPREVLMVLLKEARVTYGIDEAAVNEATVSRPEVRRIVLAKGDRAYPGCNGRNIFGEIIQAPQMNIEIEVTEDGMQAIAHSVPKKPLSRADIEQALHVADVRTGIDQQAITRLEQQGCGIDGQLVIARGVNAKSGKCGAFVAQDAEAKQVQCQVVKRGNIVAIWEDGYDSTSGQRVTGEMLSAPFIQQKKPSELAGEGVEIHREQAHIVIRACSDGLMQTASDGVVSVVPLQERFQDVAAGEEINCEQALCIYGSIADGAHVESQSAIHIEGNIGDAEIISCGDLTVDGHINAGKQKIQVAGLLQAKSLIQRDVVAQGVEVSGDIINCDIVSLAHVEAACILDSRITAADNITCRQAGDDDGADVRLWAGHHVPLAIKRDIAVLQEKRLSNERVRMVKERNKVADDLHRMKQKEYRYNVGGFIKEDHQQLIQDRLAQIKSRSEHLQQSMDDARHIIVEHKEELNSIQDQADNVQAQIHVESAFPNTEVKIADSATRRLTSEEHSVIHRLH